MPDEGRDVDADAGTLDDPEVVRERGPRVLDRMPVVGPGCFGQSARSLVDRGGRFAAVAGHVRRRALEQRVGSGRVLQHADVGVGVDVDEPRSHRTPAGVDHAGSRADRVRGCATDRDDAAVTHGHVAVESGRTAAVDDRSPRDDQIR
jgi:hypothetical protein